jgi:hypothetical protein
LNQSFDIFKSQINQSNNKQELLDFYYKASSQNDNNLTSNILYHKLFQDGNKSVDLYFFDGNNFQVREFD